MKKLIWIYALFLMTFITSCGGGGGGGSNPLPPATLTVAITSFANGATDISKTPTIQFQFNQAVLNVNSKTVYLYKQSESSDLPIAISEITKGSNNSYTFYPLIPLDSQSKYIVVLSNQITSSSNPDITLEATQFNFTTGDFIAPTVSSISPNNNETNVSLLPIVTLQFSEQVRNVTAANVVLHSGSIIGPVIAISNIIAGADNSYTFSPSSSLSSQTNYYITLTNSITDLSGNPLAPTSFQFTTGDFIIPTVNQTSPIDNATNVSLSPSIGLRFSESVINVTSTNVILRSGSLVGPIIAISNITAGADNGYTFSPSSPLLSETSYYVILTNGITDLAGNPLTQTIFQFTTGDFIVPTVSQTSPSDNSTDVSLSPIITLQFSESVINVTSTNVILRSGSITGSIVAIGNIMAGADNSYTFSPSSPLLSQTNYYVTLTNGIKDLANNQLVPTSFHFTTGDFIAPTVSQITPSNNATNVSLSPSIELRFSESVINVTGANVVLRSGSVIGPIIGITSITAGVDNTYTFSPSSPLLSQTDYYVMLTNGIKDLSGNALVPVNFYFATGL